jgi:hypothetical protein
MDVVDGCKGIEQCWLFKVNGASLRFTESVPNGTLALYSLCNTLLSTTIGNKGDIWDTGPRGRVSGRTQGQAGGRP